MDGDQTDGGRQFPTRRRPAVWRASATRQDALEIIFILKVDVYKERARESERERARERKSKEDIIYIIYIYIQRKYININTNIICYVSIHAVSMKESLGFHGRRSDRFVTRDVLHREERLQHSDPRDRGSSIRAQKRRDSGDRVRLGATGEVRMNGSWVGVPRDRRAPRDGRGAASFASRTHVRFECPAKGFIIKKRV